MNETITIGGSIVATAGTLVAAVKWLAGKLSETYEARIAACEKGIEKSDERHAECEKHRRELEMKLLGITPTQ